MKKDKRINVRASEIDIENLRDIKEIAEFGSDGDIVSTALFFLLATLQGKSIDNTIDIMIKPFLKKK